MANNKLTTEEETKYILYVIYGDKWIQEQAKGDSVKAQRLKLQLDEIGKKRVNFAEVGALFITAIDRLINPDLSLHGKELVLNERIIQGYATDVNKLNDLFEVLHKNGDLSDKSYKYIQEHKLNVSHSDFVRVGKEITAEEKTNREKMEKARAKAEKFVSGQGNKDTVASTTYDSNKESKVIKLKKSGK